MTTVLLVRHGETTWNRDRRVQGIAPAPLTDRGRTQAAAVGRALAEEFDVDRLVSSDLRRAKETTRIVNRHLGSIPITFDRGWRERSVGVLQGLTYDDFFEGYPEYAVTQSGYAAVTERPEGGESLLDLRGRVLDAWVRLVESAGPETVCVVTHGGPIRFVRGELDGLNAVETITDLDVENCSITEIGVDEHETTLAGTMTPADAVDQVGDR